MRRRCVSRRGSTRQPTPASPRPADQKPYWDMERARISGTREVPVEFLVNGRWWRTADRRRRPAARSPGDVAARASGWIAARILPSSHTNPVFVEVAGRRCGRRCERALGARGGGALLAAEGANIREPERADAGRATSTPGRSTGSCWGRHREWAASDRSPINIGTTTTMPRRAYVGPNSSSGTREGLRCCISALA